MPRDEMTKSKIEHYKDSLVNKLLLHDMWLKHNFSLLFLT